MTLSTIKIYEVRYIQSPVYMALYFKNYPTLEEKRWAAKAYFDGSEGMVSPKFKEECILGFIDASVRTIEVLDNEGVPPKP